MAARARANWRSPLHACVDRSATAVGSAPDRARDEPQLHDLTMGVERDGWFDKCPDCGLATPRYAPPKREPRRGTRIAR